MASSTTSSSNVNVDLESSKNNRDNRGDDRSSEASNAPSTAARGSPDEYAHGDDDGDEKRLQKGNRKASRAESSLHAGVSAEGAGSERKNKMFDSRGTRWATSIGRQAEGDDAVNVDVGPSAASLTSHGSESLGVVGTAGSADEAAVGSSPNDGGVASARPGDSVETARVRDAQGSDESRVVADGSNAVTGGESSPSADDGVEVGGRRQQPSADNAGKSATPASLVDDNDATVLDVDDEGSALLSKGHESSSFVPSQTAESKGGVPSTTLATTAMDAENESDIDTGDEGGATNPRDSDAKRHAFSPPNPAAHVDEAGSGVPLTATNPGNDARGAGSGPPTWDTLDTVDESDSLMHPGTNAGEGADGGRGAVHEYGSAPVHSMGKKRGRNSPKPTPEKLEDDADAEGTSGGSDHRDDDDVQETEAKRARIEKEHLDPVSRGHGGGGGSGRWADAGLRIKAPDVSAAPAARRTRSGSGSSSSSSSGNSGADSAGSHTGAKINGRGGGGRGLAGYPSAGLSKRRASPRTPP